MSREKNAGVPSITRSVRIPADLHEWATQEGININGTLTAALEARRGELNIPERMIELQKRKAFIDDELSRLREVDKQRRARAADRVHLRSCMAEAARSVRNLAARSIADVPLHEISDIVNTRARVGETMPSYVTERELRDDVRALWPEIREAVISEQEAARVKAVLSQVKETTVGI